MLQARLYLHSGFIRSPFSDVGLHLVKTRFRTGLPCSPEEDAPRNFLSAPPPFPQPTCSSSVQSCLVRCRTKKKIVLDS